MISCIFSFHVLFIFFVVELSEIAALNTKSSVTRKRVLALKSSKSHESKPKKQKKQKKEDSIDSQPTPGGTNPPPNDNPTARRGLNDIRFNKLPLLVDTNKDMFPLMPEHYPLANQTAEIVRFETMADSVVIEDEDYQLYDNAGPEHWLADTRILPIYPGEDGFWDQLRSVVRAQIARRNGDDPSTLSRWPVTWNNENTLELIAAAVYFEYPASHQQRVIEELFRDGLEMYRDLGPFRSVNDFIGRQIRLATINTWAFEAVAPVNFMMKWHIGMPRPEEMAWMIYNDDIHGDVVPDDLVRDIRAMNLQSPFDFTAYPDGSPLHPSFPAMHSAGSTVSFWLPAIARITPDQFCELLRVDYATSYARTVAGVHYPMDNLAGLNLGQLIIREKLPAFLETMYKYDVSLVTEKLAALEFDWNTFDVEACTINGTSTAEFLGNAGR